MFYSRWGSENLKKPAGAELDQSHSLVGFWGSKSQQPGKEEVLFYILQNSLKLRYIESLVQIVNRVRVGLKGPVASRVKVW